MVVSQREIVDFHGISWDNDPALLGKVKHSDLGGDQQELWNIIMEETTNNGWMLGPFSVDEMHARTDHRGWNRT